MATLGYLRRRNPHDTNWRGWLGAVRELGKPVLEELNEQEVGPVGADITFTVITAKEEIMECSTLSLDKHSLHAIEKPNSLLITTGIRQLFPINSSSV